MSLSEFISLYDDYNKTLTINDNSLNRYASVRLYSIEEWLNEHKTIANSSVVAFGFYEDELCVRLDF